MKTLRPDETDQRTIDEYLEDWQSGKEFLEALGYVVRSFDPDYAITDKDGSRFDVSRRLVDRLLECYTFEG